VIFCRSNKKFYFSRTVVLSFSRNSLIGQYTEKWCKDFFQPIAKQLGLFSVNSVVCSELGLSTQSDSDLA